MADPSFGEKAVAIYRLFSQDEVWIDGEGNRHDPGSMNIPHLWNAICFVRARAEHLELYYSYGEVLYLSNPLIGLFKAHFGYSEHDFDEDDHLPQIDMSDHEWRMADPVAFIDSTPLMQKMILAHAVWESDGDFASLARMR